ncbi:MAG: RIP metalloprotease [Gemmatimonadetes bacterium]|nr:RIP metalloprotease [Gemmatimonadota bacterium]
MLKFLAPLLVFGIVVFVHELGHFLAAKLTRVYAPVFAFGWGPRLIGFRWGETDYRWSWFPIGGFVAMATKDSEALSAIEGETDLGDSSPSTAGAGGEDGGEREGHRRGWNPIPYDPNALRPFGPHPVPSERWIESKTLPAKIFILSAGVIMNVVLALGVSTATIMGFGRGYVPAVIDSVLSGRPAALAGLQSGDSIIAIGDTPIERWNQVLDKITASPGQPLAIEVVRPSGERASLQITPALSDDVDPVTGAPVKVGRIGAAPRGTVAREDVGFGDAVVAGWNVTWVMGGAVVKVVGGLFSGEVSVKQLGGPIAIARTSFQAAKNGWEDLLSLLAFLSINVAVLNMLPIPLLDGGQILLRVVESLKGGEFSMRTQEMIARVGVMAIALLFALVMFNDIKGLVQQFFL